MNQEVRDKLISIYKDSDCIFDADKVNQAIESMACAISRDLNEANPVFLIVMKGAAVFAGQLLTHLDFPLEVDYLHATRYQGQTEGSALSWKAEPTVNLEGRTVVILDDILDEGHTLNAIVDYCLQKKAKRTYTAVLVNKQHARRAPGTEDAHYVGLQAPDRYLFGYGMDYKEYWRNASGIFAVAD